VTPVQEAAAPHLSSAPHPTTPTSLPDAAAWAVLDGNEAAAAVAYALSEVIAIYPITPASPMGEFADAWAGAGTPNLLGAVPEVIEMQSEAGAAGALHGAATRGALATTFTASQGLLLMLPNMFKLAGELTPAVIHVAARTLATHALSIFGDHSDVMAARSTGWTMLSASTVQEAHDFAAVSHAVTLATRIPVMHFFDGFRTSHEVNKIRLMSASDLAAMVDPAWLEAHRARGLTPDAPVLRGTAQNPDVFFQAREAANRFHDAVPGAVRDAFARLEGLTGRSYGLVEYAGAPDAERVVVLMGSGSGPAQEAVEALTARGEKVGVVTVRLYRPFPAADLLDVLPPTVRGIAVLDRTKEPGAGGEPLYLDVVAALAEAVAAGERDTVPRVVGGRYGLSSKEFTPAMVAAVLARAGEAADAERATSSRGLHGFTVGIADDVTHRSLPVQADLLADDLARLDPARTAVFFGLGSDGTVSANKAAVKIFGEHTDLFVQGYFVYDSKKSGAVTVSHLRLAERPIRSSYLIEQADFVACHQFSLLERMDVLSVARPGATVLLNSPHGADDVWDRIPREVQEEILAKRLRVFAIDALAVAAQAGLRQRINSVMMPAFFALSGVLPQDEALAHIRAYFEKTYGRRGRAVVERNLAAIDHALAALHEVVIPAAATATHRRRPAVPDDAPDFVQRVTARIIAGEGDLLPVSAFPVDGAFPTGTAQYEKRTLATEIPIWDPDLCIDCNKCAMVCPHTAIRAKVAEPGAFELLPSEVPHKPFKARELPGLELVIQVAPDDCTGCGICVDVCPARSKSESRRKAINLEPIEDHLQVERERFDSFLLLPEAPRADVPHGTIKGSQLLQPLFEFSGACSGCGETPYLKLLSQLFGDRAVIANATGCSSIYGGNLPTTPWTVNADGRGPAWSNSLFEDNAEFGLGIRLALDQARTLGLGLLTELAPGLGADRLIAEINDGVHDRDDAGIAAQRARVADLKARLAGLSVDPAQQARVRLLSDVVDDLVHRSVWIVGGDGWAYDIGFSGLDHAMASGRDINILVLDTEVYSNTGGQASKATPRGAVAKFAMGGKHTPKKDLGAIAMAYGSVYVAQVALGGSDVQTLRALQEAEEHRGPSLVIAYSTCIAHGIEMSTSMSHQKEAVASGYWPLYRFRPGAGEHEHPFQLDSKAPTIPFREFAKSEARFSMLARSQPQAAEALERAAQEDIDERWRYYAQLAGLERTVTVEEEEQP